MAKATTTTAGASPQADQQRRDMAIARRGELEKMMQQALPKIQALLPRGMYAQKLLQIVLNSCTKNPTLLDCAPLSILGAVMQSAQLGLVPDGIVGEAHLIPFYNRRKQLYEAQFVPGYRGLIKLAMNSGQVRRFQARVVYDGDLFDYELGVNEFLKHKPTAQTEKIIYFYSILEFLNGGVMFDVLPVAKIEQIRNAAPNYKYATKKEETIWHQYFPEMGMKTMIRRLAKYAPLSPEFARAVALDEQFETIGDTQNLDLLLLEHDGFLSEEDRRKIAADAAADGAKKNEENKEQTGTSGASGSVDFKTRASNAAQQTLNLMNGVK